MEQVIVTPDQAQLGMSHCRDILPTPLCSSKSVELRAFQHEWLVLNQAKASNLILRLDLTSWLQNLNLSFFRTDGPMFYVRLFRQLHVAECLVPSITVSHSGPEAIKQPQTITAPPLWVLVWSFYKTSRPCNNFGRITMTEKVQYGWFSICGAIYRAYHSLEFIRVSKP